MSGMSTSGGRVVDHVRNMGKARGDSDASREVAARLRSARKAALLSQAALAKRLGCSQSFVSQAETGAAVVGDAYVTRVLEACQLEPDWGAPPPVEEKPRTGWQLKRKEIAGLDPVTFEPVGKNTPRDIELAGQYKWWKDKRDERVAIEESRRKAGLDPFDISW